MSNGKRLTIIILHELLDTANQKNLGSMVTFPKRETPNKIETIIQSNLLTFIYFTIVINIPLVVIPSCLLGLPFTQPKATLFMGKSILIPKTRKRKIPGFYSIIRDIFPIRIFATVRLFFYISTNHYSLSFYTTDNRDFKNHRLKTKYCQQKKYLLPSTWMFISPSRFSNFRRQVFFFRRRKTFDILRIFRIDFLNFNYI